MKKILTTAALVCAFAAGNVQASPVDQAAALKGAMAAYQLAQVKAEALNLINWKVGDYHKMKVEFLFGGGEGTKEATAEDTARNAVWLVQEMSILGQNQKTEALMSRADGKVLELIVNGEKQDPNTEETIEIIEQSETSVTVPAGTFECLYVKANVTTQGQTMAVEVWANPIDVNLDGSLKLVAQTQFGALTILLTEFGTK